MLWRKSWSKLNIFGKNGDGVCSKRLLLPEERSVLDDYLDLAEISVIRGKVCIAKNIGYTPEQLGEILKTSVEIIKKSEEKLVEMGIINLTESRVIEIINWKKYQSEYERQLQYRVTNKGYKQKLQAKVTPRLDKIRLDKKDIKVSNTDKDKCDFNISLLTGLGLKAREQAAIINSWCGGLKARGECFDQAKCDRDFKAIVARVKKKNPENFVAYLLKAIKNHLTGA